MNTNKIIKNSSTMDLFVAVMIAEVGVPVRG